MSERFRPDLKGSDRVYEDCWQCDRDANGKPTGSVSWGAPVSGSLTYANGRVKIIGKVCFKCNGTGRIGVLVSSVRAREGNARRAAAKAQAKAEAAAAEFAKWEAINADLIAEMKASGLEWLREAAVRGFGPSQIPQMREALDAEKAEAARQAAAESVPDTSERIKITGAILGFKSVPAFQPWQPDVLKAIVQDDRGFKVYGTCARDFPDKGERVEFMAKVERSRDDRLFGFYSRPTKVKALDAEGNEVRATEPEVVMAGTEIDAW
jgi:hypothetical protein